MDSRAFLTQSRQGAEAQRARWYLGVVVAFEGWFLEANVMDENELSRIIVDCAIEVHRTLGGPGLLESVYEEALAWELSLRGIPVERQRSVPIMYKGHLLATPLKIDLLVVGQVIVECKATVQYNSIFEAQTLTYLRLTNLKLGLVINFGEQLVKNGIHRVVNGL
jgi:GxxExxY protein